MNENVAYELPNNYLGEYVSNIPWNKNPAFAFSNDAPRYLESFRNAVQIVPSGNLKIRFDSDTWNFKPYFPNINNPGYVIHFDRYPDSLRDYAKFWVLFMIAGNIKISSAKTRLVDALSIINETERTADIKSLSLLTTEDLIKVADSSCKSVQTKYNRIYAAYAFLNFLRNNYHFSMSVDLDLLKQYSDSCRVAIKQTQEDAKLPNVPEPYFQAIRNMALSIMRNASATYNNRASAALLVMLTDTGLRVSDLTALKENALNTKTLSKSGHTVSFIHYISEKPSSAHNKMLEFDIFCTDACREAFTFLQKEGANLRAKYHTDCLYVLEPTTCSLQQFPILPNRFTGIYRRLIESNLPDLCTQTWGDAIKPSQGVGQTVYIPKTEQFRVHMCSYLYNEKHLPLVWIQRYMGHLSELMLGYYVRPKDSYQEDIQKFGAVIQQIHDDNLTPLGGDGHGREIADRINAFIDANHFNVSEDIQAIADAVEDRIIIRAKTGGICIKTSLMPCARDARSDEFMCAYDLCPNLFHFFYMADTSIQNFRSMQGTVNLNQSRGNIRAAQKELRKLKLYTQKRLIPELDEMDKEINQNGVQYVLDHYPNLLDVVNNEEQIREEILKWQNVKISE